MVNDKQRVLMITVRADFGGGPEHIFRLLSMLRERTELFVACPKDFPYWGRYQQLLGADRLLELPHRRLSLKYLARLYGFIRKNKIGLIHSHGKGAGLYGRLLAALARARCVHTFHGIHADQYSAWQQRLYLMLERMLAGVSARLISVSDGEAEIVRRFRIGAPPKLVVINNGVAIPGQSATRQEGAETGTRLDVVMLTRPDHAKNPELVLDICRQLRENHQLDRFRFQVVGAGFENSGFCDRVKKDGFADDIIICGAALDVAEYFRKAFCYLSTSRREGLPLSVLEALAWGVPVVATDVVGNKDLIEHGVNGFLFDLERPEDAGRFLLQLADNRACWNDISENARQSVSKRYNLQDMADKTLAIYQEVQR